MAVIPEKDYRALLEAAEELEEIAAFDRALAREKAGEELISLEEVEARLRQK